MLVAYRRNKRRACYDSDTLVSKGTMPPPPKPVGPFQSCGDCPYTSHGFMCYTREGDCMKTDMQRLGRRNKQKKEQEETT